MTTQQGSEQLNGIDLLLAQHEQIKQLFEVVRTSIGNARKEEFDHLRALLAVHETAEEEVLRPVTRDVVPGGGEVADAVIAEENEAKTVLAKLEKMDVNSSDFLPALREFESSVLAHAAHEEGEEFPAVRANRTREQLQKMGEQIRLAERMAPTHPHPSATTTTLNYVMGPFAAMLDKVRDTMRSQQS
jgi:hemerythrin superfamily protein